MYIYSLPHRTGGFSLRDMNSSKPELMHMTFSFMADCIYGCLENEKLLLGFIDVRASKFDFCFL